MEIERKFLLSRLPDGLEGFERKQLEQAYLCTEPVVRVRREGEAFVLTYKGRGLLEREEYNLPLTEAAYRHLLAKADGLVLKKCRYRVPLDGKNAGLTAEVDVFSGDYEGLVLAEVEFNDRQSALSFVPPDWFGREVTFSGEYQNSRLAMGKSPI